jgi:serine O-acetyltransferase
MASKTSNDSPEVARKRIEGILDALVDSYASDDAINSLETHALPNRRAVIEAFGHLQHLLFLGFFSTRNLERASLRMALAEHLVPAQELLCEQIQRAAMWEDRKRKPAERRKAGWCQEVVHDMLGALPEVRRKLSGDVRAAFENDPAAESLEEVVFSYPGIIAITAYRLANLLYRAGVPMIPRILTEYAHTRTGIDIHPGASIGERFFLDHGTGVVIGATAVIGDDVKIYQGVTLGALSVNPNVSRTVQRHPTLEDGVTVYAGSTILGGDTVVGAGSVIGGNVWLVRSVPPNSKIYHRPSSDAS